MKQQHQEVGRVEEAEIVLINTCAIREGAENKVIQRIRQLRKDRKVAILGCMGERLKGRL
jgi:tRNA-2-methylthio-N6-dimethylallyladenosine synthase